MALFTDETCPTYSPNLYDKIYIIGNYSEAFSPGCTLRVSPPPPSPSCLTCGSGGEGIMQGWLEPRLKESSERGATSGGGRGRGFKTARVNGTCYARAPAHGWIPLAGFAARPSARPPGGPNLSLGKSASKVAVYGAREGGGNHQTCHLQGGAKMRHDFFHIGNPNT